MSNLKSYTQSQRFFRYAYNGKHNPQAYFNEKFLTFKWRNQNSWIDYGCFIINEKNDLHWKGISSKNNYSSPLYGSNSQTLSAVTFDPVKITLKLGLYGVTKQDYAKFYAWMDPLVIDKLFFDYDKDYYYKVKVSDLKESTKYILGSQNNQDLYYVETSVTFEIQGESCGWSEKLVEWEFTPYSRDGVWIRKGMNRNKSLDNANWISELRNGVEIYIAGISNNINTITIYAEEMDTELKTIPGEVKKRLLEINLKQSILDNISFVYNSSDGIVFNAEDKRLITLGNSNEIIKSFDVAKFLLPSKLEDMYYYTSPAQGINTIVRDVQLRVLIDDYIALWDATNNRWYATITEKEETTGQLKDVTKFIESIQIVSQLKTPLI